MSCVKFMCFRRSGPVHLCDNTKEDSFIRVVCFIHMWIGHVLRRLGPMVGLGVVVWMFAKIWGSGGADSGVSYTYVQILYIFICTYIYIWYIYIHTYIYIFIKMYLLMICFIHDMYGYVYVNIKMYTQTCLQHSKQHPSTAHRGHSWYKVATTHRMLEVAGYFPQKSH